MGTLEIEKYGHLLHGRTNSFKRKMEQAQRNIDEGLAAMGNGYIAYSSGVDSLTVLDMLYARDIRLPTLWGCDGADFSETLDFLAATEVRYDFHLIRIRSMHPWKTWCEEMSRPDLAEDPQAYDTWLNPRIWDDTWHTLTRDAPSHGYTGVFLGMLASESRTRRIMLRNGTRATYTVKSEQGITHCSPLANWTKRDIWGYIVSRGLPYNPIYDKLAAIDVPLEKRRVAALTCWRVLQYGSAVRFREIDNSLYNRLAATFPRVREYS